MAQYFLIAFEIDMKRSTRDGSDRDGLVSYRMGYAQGVSFKLKMILTPC